MKVSKNGISCACYLLFVVQSITCFVVNFAEIPSDQNHPNRDKPVVRAKRRAELTCHKSGATVPTGYPC
ncbi:hypothetical protein M758_3G167700 [Ceratodon purpureus]|uniref:Secreted protein n=1 Tax=Ceratodon purpureus TaxID=3225 RepID=A0A8T0IKV5_CERPU|nr:hypothetical protein KC19_3G168000 [Ceratodon purpureus]KAG0623353.1 hypothetical protein M758_3G167700 [Ceratodon purpureus]